MASDYPSRVDVTTWGAWETNVGTPARQSDSIFIGGDAYVATLDNEMGWKVLLKSGTWNLITLYWVRTDCSIHTWKLDTTTLGTFDAYGSSAPNTVGTISGFTVSTSGLYTLKVVAASKNASSTGYLTSVQRVTLQRTGA